MEWVNLKFFLCVIGMVLVLEGLPYFAFPEKIKSVYLKIQEASDANLRMFGFLAMVIRSAAGLFWNKLDGSPQATGVRLQANRRPFRM